ncbi:protein translocase subunit SecD [Candidatus Chlamydia corallus]|uniref:protein translocase subunit SecD n=1 Tax=Candidatus Chlamydia corallus TaxID=2038470 RepID=UPI000C2FC2E4|nr:protein translocase subunit SecD [Candidatus Chlamydia corallus]
MKQKVKRNFAIIICVFALALYYVLPTCLYYAKPLDKKIDANEAEHIIKSFTKQAQQVRKDVIPRVSAILSSLHLSGHIQQHSAIPDIVSVRFKSSEDAGDFIENLVHGEPNVPIKSSRLHVVGYNQEHGDHVIQVASSLNTSLVESDFSFVPYSSENEQEIISNILQQVYSECTFSNQKDCSCNYPSTWETAPQEQVLHYAHSLASGFEIFSSRLSAFCQQSFSSNQDKSTFLLRLSLLSNDTKVNVEDQKLLRSVHQVLSQSLFVRSLDCPYIEGNRLDCSESSLFFSCIEYCSKERKVVVKLHPDLLAQRKNLSAEQILDFESRFAMEKQRLSKKLTVQIEDHDAGLSFAWTDKDAQGKIVLHGKRLHQGIAEHLTTLLLHRPAPECCDLIPENFPIFCRPPAESESFGCYIFSPNADCKHFSKGSVYILLKGLRSITAKYQQGGGKELHNFQKDLQNLYNCFSHTEAISWTLGEDQILEITQPLQQFIDIWGEGFVIGKEGSAFLKVKDIKDRLATVNQIEKNRQSDLVRWHEQYRHAKCSMDLQERLSAPVPYRNLFLENIKLNMRKFSRGENVLRLGIDFVGGRQLLLTFKDHQGQQLTDKEDILKVSDELYARLNKLGISEIELRREGDCIHLSVPGSSTISSSEILGTSKMSFHVVNERFSSYNSSRYEVQRFLDYLWFTSQARGTTSPEEVNTLASILFNEEVDVPRSVHEAISKLKNEGLAFSPVGCETPSKDLDTTFSMIAIEKDKEQKANPLVIVFRNYALEGASLKDIRPEFAAGEGYVLNFSVKDTGPKKIAQKLSPAESFHKWTSAYCQEGISGTANGQYSGNRGWRMAVVIDGYMISSPILNAPLKNHASVSGKFTHREVSKLASDLKSGAMSFVPEVLSEETISSDLGKKQCTQGIISACCGLAMLIILMSVYYRFGGVIASGAVLLNLLLIWAALQYLDAPLTLSGLAGIVLAMGMAVDANVLVFERIREEFLLSQSLKKSVEKGYTKAFGAIFDSNLTTVLASALLFFLDTGPIKGFALTLILGIFSSMFTALFMTKFFFMMWMNKTQHTQLHMANKFVGIKHDFLGGCKKLWAVSGSIFLLGCVALGFGAWSSVLGMDFKGGYAFTFNPREHGITDVAQMRGQVIDKLKQAGLSSRDFRIQTFGSSEKIKIYFSDKALSYTKVDSSPRPQVNDHELALAVGLLSETGLDFSTENLNETQNFWSKVSSKLSKKMRYQASIGLLGALVIILLYVSLRFEWQYAFSAVCALIHDLLATCAVLFIAHFFLKKIQIDLQAIGALMTVLGYSLNNTLIIFDRIRENRQANLFKPIHILINDALQKTFSRTMMTTATTLSVLLMLLFIGGASVFNFAFIMTIGILLGTLSSLYIAPPLLLLMVRKENNAK